MPLQAKGSFRRPPTVDLSFSEDSAHVALKGELDISMAGELREQLARPEVLGARRVCVDLNRVDFLESSCIDLIVSTCKRVRGSGGSFSVTCGAGGIVRLVFEVDGLVEYLQVEGGRPPR